MGPPVPSDGVSNDADESRVWDHGEDAIVDIDIAIRSSICQGKASTAENEDITYFERTDLDTHAITVVFGRN